MKNIISIIQKVPVKKLKKMVRDAHTFVEILRQIGLDGKGRDHLYLKQRLVQEHIDFSHIPQGINHAKGRYLGGGVTPPPIKTLLVKNSAYGHRDRLKRQLLRENVLQNKCSICGLAPYWNNKPLVLQLHHKNGISNDDRLSNICLVCPNCHTQTDYFCVIHAHRKKNKDEQNSKNNGDRLRR